MKGEKINYLDGLRGVAAFAVVIAHYFQVFVPAMFENRDDISHFVFDRILPMMPLNVLYNGNFAVCLFFVLSGYVLSIRFFRSRDRGIVVASMIKRYFRLAVPAFVSVLLAYAVMKLGLSYYDEVQTITLATMQDPYAVTPSLDTLLWQTLYRTFFAYGMEYNPVLWTMTYELLGSFLIFTVLLAFGKAQIRFVVYLLGIYFFCDSYYLGFWLGMMLSDLSNSFASSEIRIKSGWALGFLTAFGLYLGSFPYVSPPGFFYNWLPLNGSGFPNAIAYHTVGAFFVLMALINSRIGQRALGCRPINYLGRISFSLYLVHFPVLCSLSSYLFLSFSRYLPYGLNLLLTIMLSMPVIFALAFLLNRWVDEKVVSLLSHIRVGRSLRKDSARRSGLEKYRIDG
jgi:peptidoglycan/LPS O-acetylase OafA/YrhL